MKRSWLNKRDGRKGDTQRARVARIKELIEMLRTDKEIVEIIMDEFACGRSTAYEDLKTAHEHSFSTEMRERMQLGVIESYRRIVRECLSAPRPRYTEALGALSKIQAAFKLNLTPEDLLGDEELRDQVAKATVANLHTWNRDQLMRLRDECLRILEMDENRNDSADKKLD